MKLTSVLEQVELIYTSSINEAQGAAEDVPADEYNAWKQRNKSKYQYVIPVDDNIEVFANVTGARKVKGQGESAPSSEDAKDSVDLTWEIVAFSEYVEDTEGDDDVYIINWRAPKLTDDQLDYIENKLAAKVDV